MTVSRSRDIYFTPEQYLELERNSQFKHEYVQGQAIAMAGATRAHNVITDNLTALFVNHLRGSGCISHSGDVKVYMPALEVFYYPDQLVTCDEEKGGARKDFILHPKLLIEVLSKSTAAFDRGDKFADYQTISSLEEYVLVHQEQVIVERFSRKADNLWVPKIYQVGDQVEFASIGLICPIEFLYENVESL
jgi:Uma2 family endonuclease